MLNRVFITTLFLTVCSFLYAQTGQNLGMPVNSQLTSEYAPSLSGNGRTLLLQSTSGEDGQPEVVISYIKAGIWSRPETVPNLNSKTGKIQISKDYVLSYDGNSILYSSGKYGGIGGFDIWIMEKQGNIWTLPKNPGKPVNSPAQEADPSLSSDGKSLYFVRYTDKKTSSGLPCGKIYVAEKVGKDTWKEPKELPASINTGCECSPRILADNQTLIFSSGRKGGKGGLDLYQASLKEDGTWSAPRPLTYVNTEKDDQYVSVPGSGDFLFYTGPSKLGTDLYRIKIPDEFRPKKVILVEGTIKDAATDAPIQGRAVAYDIKKNNIASIISTDLTGAYHMFLPEGTEYDFSVNANDKAYLFHSEYINLDTLSKYRELRPDSKLSKAKPHTSIRLSNIAFDPAGTRILDRSSFELSRIQKFLQDNPAVKVEIATYTDEVRKDTIPSPDLTENIVVSEEVPDPSDSSGIRKIQISKTTYHNDRTGKQAELVAEALFKKGIPRDRIVPKGYGDSKPLAPNINESNRSLNKRVELIIY